MKKNTPEQTPMDNRTAEIEEGTESVRRTIVGGRPLDRRRRKVRIPIGIEKALCAAASDREFLEQLVMARADALPGTGLEVSPAEAAILASVSEEALRTMIQAIDLKRHRKRRFFRGIAAASLAATTATACIGENETALSGGAAPDWPDGVAAETVSDVLFPADVIDQEMMVPQDVGIQPDEIVPLDIQEIQAGVDLGDPDVVEGHDGFAPGGVMPDMVDDPDVIDSEVAMDGGMWGDDVKDEK
ncbi:MAG: hypothetical protein ABIK09_15925 [Pseudomonadota bacterium]